ncbi:MAG: alpha-amylase family glycosyl hydrolase [Cyclobacteriaceae bacterium]|jgi:alpha-amylase
MKRILQLLITAGFLFVMVVNSEAQTGKANQPSNEVIYHVFLRSFYDSDGDRHGDFNGLRQKLDYIQDLGATAILLLPLYDADCYHNYFANDFKKMDSKFGSFEDYISLVKELHKRKMKIYMDMETQYVTYQHKWFTESINNPASPYSNYLLFDDAAHTIPSTMVFGLRELNSYDGKVIKVTTVNLKSKDVLNYNIDLFKYFMDPNKDGKFDDGVDGFRLDHAMDKLDDKPTLTNLLAEFWNPLIKELKKVNPAVSVVAEQADWNDYGYSYFEKGGVDRMFGFGLQRAILSFNKKQLAQKADSVLNKIPKGTAQIIFLENHDLDRFATLEPNLQKQKLAASLQLLIGGIPSIYYGQEIGMKGKGMNGQYGNGDGNDIPRREAFEWYANEEGTGAANWYANTGVWWTKRNNQANDGISVEEQKKDPNSLLNHYKQLLQLRASHPALATGTYSDFKNDNEYVFSFARTSGTQRIVVAANLSDQPQSVTFQEGIRKFRSVGKSTSVLNNRFELKPYEWVVWEVK